MSASTSTDAMHYRTVHLHYATLLLQCAQDAADTLRQTHPGKLHSALLKHAHFVFSTLSSSFRLSQKSFVFTVEHLIVADGMYLDLTIT